MGEQKLRGLAMVTLSTSRVASHKESCAILDARTALARVTTMLATAHMPDGT